MFIFPAIFKNVNNSVLMRFPDIPNSEIQCDNFEEAYGKSKEVLCEILYNLDYVPNASSVRDIREQYPDYKVVSIGVDLEQYIKNNPREDKSLIEVTVKIPKNLIKAWRCGTLGARLLSS